MSPRLSLMRLEPQLHLGELELQHLPPFSSSRLSQDFILP